MSDLTCPECGENDFEQMEEESQMCLSCGHELSLQDLNSIQAYKGYVVGLIQSVEVLKKGKLSKVQVDIAADEPLSVVTNAKYIAENDRVVVATIGSIVPAGAKIDEDTNAIEVKKSSVGGCASFGVLCDAPMLSWNRGTKGQLVKLPDTCEIGSRPPSSDPDSSGN